MNYRPVSEYDLSDLRNFVANYRRAKKTDHSFYQDVLAEIARRTGKGLDFDTTCRLVREAASAGRFLSYKQLADGSGANWSHVRHAMNAHLGDLVEYAHRSGWPLLSAIVVNQSNVETGAMDPSTLRGFAAAARELGYRFVNAEQFLRDQQQLVFRWAKEGDAPQTS